MEPEVVRLLRAAGIAPFTAPFDANLVAVRDSRAPRDTFDGRLHLVYRDTAGVWHDVSARAATRPGTHYLQHPMNAKGTFVLRAGVRNAGSHRLGFHKNDPGRPGWVQRAKVVGYRDGDRDADLDPGDMLYNDAEGVNVHDIEDPAWLAGCIGAPKTELAVLRAAFETLQRARPQETVSLAVLDIGVKPV